MTWFEWFLYKLDLTWWQVAIVWMLGMWYVIIVYGSDLEGK